MRVHVVTDAVWSGGAVAGVVWVPRHREELAVTGRPEVAALAVRLGGGRSHLTSNSEGSSDVNRTRAGPPYRGDAGGRLARLQCKGCTTMHAAHSNCC